MTDTTALDPKVTYTATIVLSSTGDTDTVVLDGVFFQPDISDVDIDNGNVPWSYRVASYMIKNLRKEVFDPDPNKTYSIGSRSVQ